MTTDRGETIREKIIKKGRGKQGGNPPTDAPPPANLAKQDCGGPAAAAAGSGAPWDTIIGFHYAAISLK